MGVDDTSSESIAARSILPHTPLQITLEFSVFSMAKPPKPRWGWTQQWDRDDLDWRLSRIDFRKIASGIGVRDAETLSRFDREINRALALYHFTLEMAQAPTRSEIEAACKEVGSRAGLLMHVLKELDDRSRLFLQSELDGPDTRWPHAATNADAVPFGPSPGELELDNLQQSLRRLLGAAHRLVEETPAARRGRKANESLSTFIAALADIYEEFTGMTADAKSSYDPDKRKYGGPFFMFVEEVLASFAPEMPVSNNALGEAIRRALGKR